MAGTEPDQGGRRLRHDLRTAHRVQDEPAGRDEPALRRLVARTKGKRTATHALVGKDRSDASHIVEVVEFPSYEEAVRNSNLPETDRIFRDMVALCDEAPTFTDLDVVRDELLTEITVRRFFEALEAPGELSPLNDLLDEDIHSHDPMNPQDTIGLDSVRSEYRMWRAAFDFSIEIEDVLAQGDRACARWTWTATHKGDFLGIAPTGKRVSMMVSSRLGGWRGGREVPLVTEHGP